MSTIGLAALVFVLSLAGGLAPIGLHTTLDEKRMRLLTGIAAGFLLGSSLLVVVPEGFQVAEEVGGISEVALGSALLGGFLLMLILEGLGVGHSVHEEHHDHARAHGHGHLHHPDGSATLPLGLSIHAIADGLAIGAAGAAGETAAALVAFAVLLHKVPAAFSLGVFTSHERSTKGTAVRDVAAFALVTPLVMIMADQFFDAPSTWVAAVLLFSAGTFLYVATVDTLPAIHAESSGLRTALEVVFGAAVFGGVYLGVDALGLISELH